jgi:uncharacterized protein
MKSLFASLEYDRNDANSYWILFSAPVLLTFYYYYGTAGSFSKYFPTLGELPEGDCYAHIAQFIAFFILVLAIPVVSIRLKIKKPLSYFGFASGDIKYGLVFILIALPLLILPLMYIGSGMEGIRAEYPMAKILFQRHDLIVLYETAYVLFYYFAWEFFFRGFLLFGLKPRFGAMNAVLIQTISSCLIHLGKPDGEILGSIFVGIIFGALALRTRSFIYVFILHAVIGVTTDLFIIFR